MSDSVNLVIAPRRPETAIVDGYGVAIPRLGMLIEAEFVNETAGDDVMVKVPGT